MNTLIRHFNIGIIEDNSELLGNYVEFFSHQINYSVCFSCASISEFIEGVNSKTVKPNIILLDINLPGISGIEGIEFIKKKFPKVIIVMLTAYSDREYILKALEYGANGYLIKGMSLEDMKQHLNQYEKNGSAVSPKVAKELIDHFRSSKLKEQNTLAILTPREKEIALCIVNGHTQKQAAEILGIKFNTINHHLKNIYTKLGVNTQVALIKKIINV